MPVELVARPTVHLARDMLPLIGQEASVHLRHLTAYVTDDVVVMDFARTRAKGDPQSTPRGQIGQEDALTQHALDVAVDRDPIHGVIQRPQFGRDLFRSHVQPAIGEKLNQGHPDGGYFHPHRPEQVGRIDPRR